jgi:hypothetical protein
LEQVFRYVVLKTLLTEGKINSDVVAMMDEKRHPGYGPIK